MSNTETLTIAAFECATAKVCTFVQDGTLWIIGADVAAGVGLENASNSYRRLAADEKRTLRRVEAGLKPGGDMVAVSESGFYKLVMRSDKPEAHAFQEWVTREVLPAIRQTGGYRLQGVAPEAVQEGTVSEMPDVGGRSATTNTVKHPLSACKINP